MGLLQNQNQSLVFSQPEVIRLESTAQQSAVNNIVIVLCVLIFILQLCLALFFMLRCFQYDNRIREALKQPTAVKIILGIYEESRDHLYDAAGSSSPAVSAVEESYEQPTGSLSAPHIYWDLVQ